ARGSSSRGDKGSSRSDLLLLGLGLYVLGLAGAFFGWLIQAAVSRQREFLADASAVQFTRNPDGIGGALKKIGGMAEGATIANPPAQESHQIFLRRRLHPPSEQSVRHPPAVGRAHQAARSAIRRQVSGRPPPPRRPGRAESSAWRAPAAPRRRTAGRRRSCGS